MRPPEPQYRYTPVPAPTLQRPLSDGAHPGNGLAPPVVWGAQPSAPIPVPAPVPVVMERPPVRASGVTAYGLALAVGLVVAASGLGFAAGRMTADEPSTGSGRLAAIAAGGGVGFGSGALPDAPLGPGAASDQGLSSATATLPEGEGDLSTGSGPIDGRLPGGGPSSTGSDAAAESPTGPDGAGFSPDGPPAFALGGLEGTVGEITIGGFTLATADGRSLDVTTDADTTYLRQSAVSADGIAVGDTVRIEPAGFGPGSSAAGDQAAQPAASIIIVSPDELSGTPGSPPGMNAADAGALPAPGGGPGDRRGMLVGMISTIADGTLMLTLADGTENEVQTDDSTTFWVEEPVAANEIASGATVRVRPSFGGPSGVGGPDQGAGSLTAGRITIVEAAT